MTLFLHALRFDVLESGPDQAGSQIYSGALFGFLITGLLVLVGQGLQLAPAELAPLLFLLTALAALPSILSEIGATFLDPRDVSLLRTLPVSGSQYLWARLGALTVALVLKALSFGLLPALYFSTGDRGPPWAFASYLVALFLLLFSLAVASALLFFFLQRLVDSARLRDLLVWVQVVMFVAGTAGWLMFFTGQLGDFVSGGVDAVQVRWWPNVWFAGLFSLGCGTAMSDPVPALLALAVPGLGVLCLAVIGRRYLDLLASIAAMPARSRKQGGTALRRAFQALFVTPRELPGFKLALALIRRERTFRLQSYPLLGYPVVFLIFGRGQDDGGLFALCFSHFATLTLPLALLFLRYSDAPAAAWVQSFHAQHERKALWSGARKAFVFAVVVPLYLIVAVLLGLDRGAGFGAYHGAMAMALAVWVVVRLPIPVSGMPFSERFEGALYAADEVRHVYGLFPVVLLAGGAQFFLWHLSPLYTLPVVLLAVGVSLSTLRRVPAGPEAGPTAATGPAVVQDPSFEPFRSRLPRELRALAVFYAAAGLVGLLVASAL